jgi:chorismate-pyruvate lyase
VAGELLVEHATRLVRTAILCASGAVLVAATAFFATGHYLS